MADSSLTIEQMQRVVDSIRHCVLLGFKVHEISDKNITIKLPFSEQLVGNPDQRIIHGGVLTTLLDTTCGMSIPLALNGFLIAPTLDLRIDYMTTAKPGLTLYARAEAYRVTRNVVFARGIAFQDDDSKPIAHCVATFMRLPKEIADATAYENIHA